MAREVAPCHGVLYAGGVGVFDEDHIKFLKGKRLGTSSKIVSDMVLVLMPEEALFAIHRRWLELGNNVTLPPPDQARFSVFRELWTLGLWVSPGIKFGAHFLAYTDDPSTHHSSYIVFVTGLNDCNPVLDLVSLVRLGTNVGKTIVQASCGPNSDDKPRFISCSWHQTMSNPPKPMVEAGSSPSPPKIPEVLETVSNDIQASK